MQQTIRRPTIRFAGLASSLFSCFANVWSVVGHIIVELEEASISPVSMSALAFGPDNCCSSPGLLCNCS